MRANIILYVDDQERSKRFYVGTLGFAPILDVPGMTEFTIGTDLVLGLMPAAGIVRLLGDAIRDPRDAGGIPRAELYLIVPDAAGMHAAALAAGARELSPVTVRDWGHRAGYVADPDGHVVAFAEVE
jgi:catechol 2,3-dioxygenase-like lactoylglutathione lyase family enzyme